MILLRSLLCKKNLEIQSLRQKQHSKDKTEVDSSTSENFPTEKYIIPHHRRLSPFRSYLSSTSYSHGKNQTDSNKAILFIKKLDENVTHERINHLFAPYGPILDVKLQPHPYTAFQMAHVKLGSEEKAEMALAALDGTMFGKVEVEIVNNDWRLELDNIPMQTTKQDLLALLAEKGATGAKLWYSFVKDENENKPRFAFCNFASRKDTEKAFKCLQECYIEGVPLLVNFRSKRDGKW